MSATYTDEYVKVGAYDLEIPKLRELQGMYAWKYQPYWNSAVLYDMHGKFVCKVSQHVVTFYLKVAESFSYDEKFSLEEIMLFVEYVFSTYSTDTISELVNCTHVTDNMIIVMHRSLQDVFPDIYDKLEVV